MARLKPNCELCTVARPAAFALMVEIEVLPTRKGERRRRIRKPLLKLCAEHVVCVHDEVQNLGLDWTVSKGLANILDRMSASDLLPAAAGTRSPELDDAE